MSCNRANPEFRNPDFQYSDPHYKHATVSLHEMPGAEKRNIAIKYISLLRRLTRRPTTIHTPPLPNYNPTWPLNQKPHLHQTTTTKNCTKTRFTRCCVFQPAFGCCPHRKLLKLLFSAIYNLFC